MGIRSNGSGYLTAGITGFPNTGASQSVSFWASPSTYTSGIVSWINVVGGTSNAIQIGARESIMCAWTYGGGHLVDAASNPTVALHHFVYTFDATTHRIYIDGALSNSNATGNGSATITSVQIFGNEWGENSTVTLEDVRVYSRTLSLPEVNSIYNSRGRNTIFQNLVARWLLWSGASGTNVGGATGIKDVSNNANHGISLTSAASNYTYQESYVLSKPRPKVLK